MIGATTQRATRQWLNIREYNIKKVALSFIKGLWGMGLCMWVFAYAENDPPTRTLPFFACFSIKSSPFSTNDKRILRKKEMLRRWNYKLSTELISTSNLYGYPSTSWIMNDTRADDDGKYLSLLLPCLFWLWTEDKKCRYEKHTTLMLINLRHIHSWSAVTRHCCCCWRALGEFS